jgi:signal transduction histidine kinase
MRPRNRSEPPSPLTGTLPSDPPQGGHLGLRYSTAMASVLLALLLALALEPLMGHVPFSALFLAAVMLSTWYGGLGPGLLATALAALAVNYFFELPRYSLVINDLITAVDLGLFVLTALLITSLNANLRQARRRAEAAQRDLAFLAEASNALTSSLDYEATLQTVARLAVPALADLCFVDLAETHRSVHRLAVAHRDPTRERWARDLQGHYPAHPDAAHGAARVLRSGQPELIPEVAEPVEALFPLLAAHRSPEHLAALRTMQPRSLMTVPLIARGRTLGAITLVSTEPTRHYGAAQLALAEELAGRCALTIENARLYGALAERERQLQDLVGRLILAQEEERRRVAYELHDGVAQTAAGAHLHLRGFARRYQAHLPEAREELDRAVELAQRVVREARGVVAELRPTALDDLGLEAALEAEVEELRKDGWQVEYEADLGAERLAPAVETALFRVAQEALRNARKHAGAARARVALRRTERAVQLEVRDWGRGFDPARLPAGGGPGERVGLSGMRERCALLGGQCEVQSQPGAGTRIVAEVPVPAPADEAEGSP